MDADLANHFQDAADAVIRDILIDGKASSDWKEVQFEKRHSILHWLPAPKHYKCRLCAVESGTSPDTLLGRQFCVRVEVHELDERPG